MKSNITVIIPVLNGMPYIKLAVESIISQTYNEWELFIIDGNSTDGTLEYLDNIGDERIRVFKGIEGGYAGAMNFGLNQAKSKWVAMLDADDISSPERFEKQIKEIENNDVAMIGSFAYRIGPTGKHFGTIISKEITPSGIYQYLHNESNCILNPSVMYDRVKVIEVGGYRQEFAPIQDYDLWLRLSEKYSLMIIPEYLVSIRIIKGSVTSSNVINMRYKSRYARECARLRLKHQKEITFSEFMEKYSTNNVLFRIKDKIQDQGSKFLRLAATNLCEERIIRALFYTSISFIFRPIRTISTIKKLL